MHKYTLWAIFIVFLTLCAYTRGADECGGNGLLENDVCLCYSGFAPSTTADVDCDDTVDNTCVWQVSNSSFTAGPANISSASFTANTLTLVIESPVTINRTLTSISIGGSTDPACVYPGANFAKTLDGCNDVFTGVLPWADIVTACNFVEDTSDPDFIQFSASVMVTNTQQIGDFRGVEIGQNVTDALPLVVKFQKQISVNSSTTVVAPVNMFSAVTDQSYSPTTQEGSVSFVTSLEWPFSLSAGSVVTVPTGLTVDPTGLTVDNTQCADTANSTCFQTFNFLLIPGAVCQLTGIYTIDFTIICRGSGDCPLDSASDTATLTLSLQSSDFCAAVSTGITASASMATFQDAAFTTAKTAFLVGQTGFFQIQVTSAQATVTSATISTVNVIIDTTATSLYASGAAVDPSISVVTAGSNTASFQIDFDATLFIVPTDQALSYAFNVEVLVSFDDNTKKRAIFAAGGGAPATTQASSQVSLTNTASATPDPISTIGSSSTASTASVSYVLGGMLLCAFCLMM